MTPLLIFTVVNTTGHDAGEDGVLLLGCPPAVPPHTFNLMTPLHMYTAVLSTPQDMTLVKKESYCWCPNSIVIERGAFSYFLTSFLSRNAAYDLITRLRDRPQRDNSRWGQGRWGIVGYSC